MICSICYYFKAKNNYIYIFIEIKLQLIDEGNKIINEHFDKIILYNFVESDCNLPEQLVLNCSLSDMWFPVINFDTTLVLQPHFKIGQLYKILIVKTDESGTNVVQMIHKDTHVDVSDAILQSGIGQRLNAAMKTGIIIYNINFFEYYNIKYIVYSILNNNIIFFNIKLLNPIF